jgi:hypothetical protein
VADWLRYDGDQPTIDDLPTSGVKVDPVREDAYLKGLAAGRGEQAAFDGDDGNSDAITAALSLSTASAETIRAAWEELAVLRTWPERWAVCVEQKREAMARIAELIELEADAASKQGDGELVQTDEENP